MLRLYIEDFSEERVWSVDEGDSSTAQRYKEVVVHAFGTTKYDPTQDNKKEPMAWIEFPDAKLKVFSTTALIRD